MINSIKTIKKLAREKVNKNFGDAFIIVFVPFFIMNAFIIILSQITSLLPDVIEFYIEFVMNVFFTIFAGYLSYKLVIQFVKSDTELTFNNFFDIDSGFLNFIILSIISAMILLFSLLPSIPLFVELLQKISMMVDPDAISGYLQHSNIIPRLVSSLKISSFLFILFWFITIRIQMLPFIVVDKNVSIVEAFSISIKMTRGNYLMILLFPFTYILWGFVFFTFIGAFYVIPLIFVGYGYLYVHLDNEYQKKKD